jgi:Dyp-type peroxidase family
VTTAQPDVADVQGIVTYGYRDLGLARLVLLRAGDSAALRAWVGAVAGQVTDATTNPTSTAVNLALTPAGLGRLGLPEDVLGMFSDEFLTGMTTEHRRRLLGDVDEGAPERWAWGGPAEPQPDALLMLYAPDQAGRAALVDAQSAAYRSHGLTEAWAMDTVDLGRREHFGFRDGISQPAIEGVQRSARPDDVVKAGEFLLGYVNEYGKYTDRPLVPPAYDPAGVLPGDPAGSGRRDLGRNGAYLVLRQLAQDVPGFWAFAEQATLGANGSPDEAARTLLAAKMVGRWPSGAPLVQAPAADDSSRADANDFRYVSTDASGNACPIGSHIRRSNPRDSLDPRPGSDASVAVGKRHRILRRGRSYGLPDGSEERGLLFMCVCANIARQFEFIQHTWVNNPKFDGLYDDADPLLSGHRPYGGTFTVQASPVRRRYLGLPRFVTVRGGGYFFLPGLRALRYLAGLGAG